ncbi:MAG: hypothetical protein COW85_13885 [Ignavibacteria bacterium CG22_combo_CG10-13_8_21_14_all_37_15]|nr:MAG: hypothetical protein COW85_13885 [Ignavibacteria bacterium CG22_combo_CG10-13_8_21_14_all_37_15]
MLAYWYNIPKDSMHLKMVNKTFQFYSTIEVYGKTKQDSFALKIEVYQEYSKKIFNEEFFIKNKKTDKDCQLSFINDCFKLVYPVEYAGNNPDKIILTISDSNGQRTKEIQCRYHKLYGRVYDFGGNPFKSFITIRPDDFNFNTSIWSDSLGYYEIELPERTYNDIAVVDEDYGIKVAEAWGWHIIMDTDQNMDFKIGTGEVYNLNVWPNNGGGSTYFVSFRPMSLHLYGNAGNPQPVNINGKEFKLINLIPKLEIKDIKVLVNGKECTIFSIQEYFETGSENGAVKAYLLQIDKKGLNKTGKQNLLLEFNLEEEIDGKKISHNAVGYFQFFTNFHGLSNYY